MEAVWTELTDEALAEILAGTRKRGQYLDIIKDFDNAEFPGIEIKLTEGPLKGKTATTVFAGFSNVLKAHAEHSLTYGTRVDVRKVGERVFLVRTAEKPAEVTETP